MADKKMHSTDYGEMSVECISDLVLCIVSKSNKLFIFLTIADGLTFFQKYQNAIVATCAVGGMIVLLFTIGALYGYFRVSIKVASAELKSMKQKPKAKPRKGSEAAEKLEAYF